MSRFNKYPCNIPISVPKDTENNTAIRDSLRLFLVAIINTPNKSRPKWSVPRIWKDTRSLLMMSFLIKEVIVLFEFSDNSLEVIYILLSRLYCLSINLFSRWDSFILMASFSRVRVYKDPRGEINFPCRSPLLSIK